MLDQKLLLSVVSGPALLCSEIFSGEEGKVGRVNVRCWTVISLDSRGGGGGVHYAAFVGGDGWNSVFECLVRPTSGLVWCWVFVGMATPFLSINKVLVCFPVCI